jgi:hypothetical protein
MIINYTYPNPKLKNQIKKSVGSSFGFIERFKMGGIGTSKLQMVEASDEIYKLVSHKTDTIYCYIECRNDGIVVGFHSTLKVYLWLIPYLFLEIELEDKFVIIRNEINEIKLKVPFNGKLENSYFNKIDQLKLNHLNK